MLFDGDRIAHFPPSPTGIRLFSQSSFFAGSSEFFRVGAPCCRLEIVALSTKAAHHVVVDSPRNQPETPLEVNNDNFTSNAV
jgi:hypothetical protein